MKVRLIKSWQEIRSSYWFVPAVMAAAAIGLSFLTIYLDSQWKDEIVSELGLFWTGGPEGARGLLETVAGSMITVAGVTFSITMVALSMASSQFGSRLLRSFMSDTGNQVVLGTFTATFIYCLLVLRTVRSGDGDEFVPYISVSMALLFAVASLGVLIYFIHHAAQMMQDQYVIGEVASDLLSTIERLFPEGVGVSASEQPEADPQKGLPADFEQQTFPVPSTQDGYLQAMDTSALLRLARDNDLILSIPYRPGHFIIQGACLVQAWPEHACDEKLAGQLRRAFLIGRQRTHTQDVEFAVEQLVEVAIRSLSTGINDPFTAIACIDWLGAALSQLAGKQFPSPYRYDQDGRMRLFFHKPVTFSGVIDAAFNLIRQNAGDSVAVQMRLLEMIEMIASQAREAHRPALARQAEMLHTGAHQADIQKGDQKQIDDRYQKAKEALKG
jgi:uncharacterized membrane protein